MSDVQVAAPARTVKSLDGALLRYRIMAYLVGTGLVILVLIGIPLQVWGHNDVIAVWVGTAHGWLFMVYLLLTFDLARRARWHLIRVAVVGLCGTIPFLSFYAERKVTGWVRAQEAENRDLTD
jgi:integral membrane protein